MTKLEKLITSLEIVTIIYSTPSTTNYNLIIELFQQLSQVTNCYCFSKALLKGDLHAVPVGHYPVK